MEISEPTIIVYYSSRILGFAPYSLKRNKLHQITEIKFNVFLCAYSVLILSSLIGLTIYGLVHDTNSKLPLRMKSPTSAVVTGLDVNVVVGSCLIGMLSAIFNMKNTQEINQRLKEADHYLDTLNRSNMSQPVAISERRKATILVVFWFTWILSMLVLDIWGWLRNAAKLRVKHPDAGPIERNVFCFLPFYALYVFLMGLQIQFASSTFGIGRRYRRLNAALETSFSADPPLMQADSQMGVGSSIIGLSVKRETIHVLSYGPNHVSIYKNHTRIDRFASVHNTLGKSMINASRNFGATILVLLISCLLHLVATAYFFFLEILGEKDPFFITLQFLWLVFHVSRLILIVEPCHLVSVENLKFFWQQLLADKAFFSACGMCRIDRQLLTSLSAAIATYLVILLQFQMIDGS